MLEQIKEIVAESLNVEADTCPICRFLHWTSR